MTDLSVLDMGAGMRSGSPPRDRQQRRTAATRSVREEVGDVIPDATPQVLGAMMIGALLTIVALRLGGFRFSFGAGVGSGGG